MKSTQGCMFAETCCGLEKLPAAGACMTSSSGRTQKKAWESNYVGGTHAGRILSDSVQKNNTSGIRGVSWHGKTKKWYARVAYKGRTYSLGYYGNKEEAGEAVRAARERIRADFLAWHSENYPERQKEK